MSTLYINYHCTESSKWAQNDTPKLPDFSVGMNIATYVGCLLSRLLRGITIYNAINISIKQIYLRGALGVIFLVFLPYCDR